MLLSGRGLVGDGRVGIRKWAWPVSPGAGRSASFSLRSGRSVWPVPSSRARGRALQPLLPAEPERCPVRSAHRGQSHPEPDLGGPRSEHRRAEGAACTLGVAARHCHAATSPAARLRPGDRRPRIQSRCVAPGLRLPKTPGEGAPGPSCTLQQVARHLAPGTGVGRGTLSAGRSRGEGGAKVPPPGTHFLLPPFPSPDRRRRERSTEPECLRPPAPGRARPRMSRWPTSRFPAELPAHPERRWESGRRVWAPLSRPKGVVGALSCL